MSTDGGLVDFPFVDHHCHGVVTRDLDRSEFEDLLSESAWPAPDGCSHLDSPIGLAVRRLCAPVLDLPALADPEDYLARRAELGAAEVNRRLLRGSRTSTFLLDTGYRADDILDPEGMQSAAGAATHEVVRLEVVAEAVAAGRDSAAAYPEQIAAAVSAAAERAVGFKTIVAYRGGFAFDPTPPQDQAVADAAGRWFATLDGREPRLEDPVLQRHLLWSAADVALGRGLPIQFHCGYGDPDITLHLTNPSLLTDLLKAWRPLGVPVTLLHCYPYHREAGYLAAVLPDVHFDVGLAVNYTGAGARRVVEEALELAPFTKHLYSSDAFGLPELYHLGAALFREALAAILEGWVRTERCSRSDAVRIAHLIGGDNARRIYPLGAPS